MIRRGSQARGASARWGRGLPIDAAAEYVGISPSALLAEVKAGHAPTPTKVTRGRQVWLREKLDEWLDRLDGKTSPAAEDDDPWQKAIDGGFGGTPLS